MKWVVVCLLLASSCAQAGCWDFLFSRKPKRIPYAHLLTPETAECPDMMEVLKGRLPHEEIGNIKAEAFHHAWEVLVHADKKALLKAWNAPNSQKLLIKMGRSEFKRLVFLEVASVDIKP